MSAFAALARSGEKDDGVGSTLAEFTQPLVLRGAIPGPRRLCRLELEDDEALIGPAALQRPL